MKNLLVANFQAGGKISENALRKLIEAQIENSIEIGWRPEDIVIVTNLKVLGKVTVVEAPLNQYCLTGSKMFALEHLFEVGMIAAGDIWWAHDLDAWQNFWFEPPPFADIALAEYSLPKFNGGSVLLRSEARDLVQTIVGRIRKFGLRQEEPAINSILRKAPVKPRVTVLNSTFNVGCSAYRLRYDRSNKPILVAHFNPASKVSWRTHVHGGQPGGKSSVSPRLLSILVRYFHGGILPSIPGYPECAAPYET